MAPAPPISGRKKRLARANREAFLPKPQLTASASVEKPYATVQPWRLGTCGRWSRDREG